MLCFVIVSNNTQLLIFPEKSNYKSTWPHAHNVSYVIHAIKNAQRLPKVKTKIFVSVTK